MMKTLTLTLEDTVQEARMLIRGESFANFHVHSFINLGVRVTCSRITCTVEMQQEKEKKYSLNEYRIL